MKLNTTLSHEAEYIGDIQENRVGIDKSNLDFITTLLTSNLYSQPLESFFRETVANAYDSHVEAGTDEHILLLIEDTVKYHTYRISIRDYGVGISPERFDKIYKNIGSSTKRESNDYIGMFGIGRFSCLSCADTAHITSYYQGTKYSYIMYKNGGGINIDLISTTKGDYKDGLEVSIEKFLLDTSPFSNALINLCLFDKVYVVYKGDNRFITYAVDNFNNRQIVHNKTFSRCSILPSHRNYFKVGNVLYTGNTPDLHTVDGIIVDLPIGSVDITPNREELQYTDYTNETIKTQVALVKQELQEIVNNKISGDYSLQQFCDTWVYGSAITIKDTPIILRIDREDVDLDFTNITIDQETVPDNYWNFLNAVKYYNIDKGAIYKIISPSDSNYGRRYNTFDIKHFTLGDYVLMEKADKVTNQVTLRYAQDQCVKTTVILGYEELAKCKAAIKKYYTSYHSHFNLQSCIDFTFKHLHIKTLSNRDVPDNYIEDYRKEQRNKRKKIDTSRIPVRVYHAYNYTLGYLDNLPSKGLIIYTVHSPNADSISQTLRELAELLHYSSSVAAIITVKKDYISILESNNRCISLENFLYTKNKILSKFVTYRIILNRLSGSIVDSNSLPSLPILSEFKKKYINEATMNRHILHNGTVTSIINYYQEKGWVNQSDIDYFVLTTEEKAALEDWKNLLVRKFDVIKRITLKRHGVLPKIGLTLWPKFE